MTAKFQFIRLLDRGNFSEVWLAIDTTLNFPCAVKCIPLEKIPNRMNFFQEAQVLKAVEHPNIVRVYDAGTLDDRRVYVSMEYLKNGSISTTAGVDYVHLIRAKLTMIDVLRGLAYAHSKNITHRDIKPGNILLTDSLTGKLSDFGLAMPPMSAFDKRYVDQYLYPTHLAPEVRSPHDYTHLADIYACGATLYRMINGDAFFQRQGMQLGQYREFVPTKLIKLIEKATHSDPEQRFPMVQDMKKALEQIPIYANWHEEHTNAGMKWTLLKDACVYVLERVQDDRGTWSIIAKRGTTMKTLRRGTKFCKDALPEKAAIKECKRILQEFVVGNQR